MLRIQRLDHLVLTVKDIEATCDFYSRVLGMKVAIFGSGRRALHFGNQKINLHQKGRELQPAAIRPRPGSSDLCFITEIPIAEVAEHLARQGVAIIEGPVRKTGANGPIMSVYFRDPDGNLLEVSNELERR